MPPENLSLPEDITALGVDELTTFETDALARFDTLEAATPASPEEAAAQLAEMTQLASDVKRARLQKVAIEQATQQAAAAREELTAFRAELAAEAAAVETEPVTAATRPQGGATTQPRSGTGLKLNVSLADAQRNAPAVPERRRESVLTASADIPDFAVGQKLDDAIMLVAAMQSRARTLPITARGDEAPRYPIASLTREHRFNLSLDSTPAEVNEVLVAAGNPDILTAAGGWCSPSEISYDLFNIVCEDGMLDLPTVGINRGGIRWPTSPSFADVTSSSALFSWTETQDIAAVTGTAQSGVKTCGRVPCPGFNEARLHCDGICLTVGNLTEDAYPETISNFMKLLQVANARKINRLRINQLAAFAITPSVTGTFGAGGEGVVAPVLGAIELQAIDYRERYSMCVGATLEVILPRWLRGAMRSDLRRRTGATTEQLSVTDATLMSLFDAAGVRIQWVSDYQVRTTGFPGVPGVIPTAWPTAVEFMMYAPGTVVLGQGMRLNLGIIRDSIMNQTNDHTAAWMEDCWLMFNPGHEVRRGSILICPDGTTGAHDLTACGV